MKFTFSIYNPSLLSGNFTNDKPLDLHDYTKNQHLLNDTVSVNIQENSSEKFKEIVTTYRHSPHSFKEGLRKTSNFVSTSGIILDFDNKGEHNDSSIKEFVNSTFAKTFAYILYTSKSHTELANSYHVYIPLATPIHDSKTYRELLMLLGIHLKNQDDLRTDLAILRDTGNRFIYPSRHSGEMPNYQTFQCIVDIYKTNAKGEMRLKEGKNITKTLLSLGYLLEIPYLNVALEKYHLDAQRALQEDKVDIKPIDTLNNKLDYVVVEGAKYFQKNALEFTEPEWFTLGQALFNHYGEHAKELYIRMSTNDYGDSEETIERKWESYQKNIDTYVERPVTIRSFLYIIQNKGFEGAYSLDEIDQGIKRIDKDLDLFLNAMYKALMTKDKVFFFTKPKQSKCIMLNKAIYSNLSNNVYSDITALDLNQEGITLHMEVAELKVSDFLSLVEKTATLPTEIKHLVQLYTIGDKNGANILFNHLIHKLTLNSATTSSINVQRIAGLTTPSQVEIRPAYPFKVKHIRDVVKVDTGLGRLFYYNPIIDYPQDMQYMEGERFKKERKLRAGRMQEAINAILEQDEIAITFFKDFMAQYTCEYRVKANRCSIVLTGVRGSGKNTLVENIIGEIFQTKEIVKRDKKIDKGQFSDLFSKKLALFDETEVGKSYEIEDMLKMTSGGTFIKMEKKFKDAHSHLIYAYAVILSNAKNVLGITDTPTSDKNNQFYVKHLDLELSAKTNIMIDDVFIKKHLRCYLDEIIIPHYELVVSRYDSGYRYGLPVPITSNLIRSKKQKVSNTYSNVRLKLQSIDDEIHEMLYDDKILPKDLTFQQALLAPHFHLLVHKHLLTKQLVKAITGRTQITSTALENTLLQMNDNPNFELTAGARATVAKRTYAGYKITAQILREILSTSALSVVDTELDKAKVNNIVVFHNINTTKLY